MLHRGKQACHEHCSSRSQSSQNAGPATKAALLLQLMALWSYLIFLNICIRLLFKDNKTSLSYSRKDIHIHYCKYF